MVLFLKEERTKKQDKRAQQFYDLEIWKKEQEEQAQIWKTEQEKEFHQAKLATLKQLTLLKHSSTAKADKSNKFYNLLKGLDMLKFNLFGLAKKDLYDV